MNMNWQDLTAPELKRLVSDESIAAMVLGAIEQHGSHLPLSCDLDIGCGLLARARAQLPGDFSLVELPAMAIGASEEHLGYAGTLSIAPETAIASLESIGAALSAVGIKRLVLCNSHGGNIAWMETAALRLRRRFGMLVVKMTYTRLGHPPDGLDADELRHGIHGGALETALMRALAPNKVREDQLGCFKPVGFEDWPGPTGDVSWAWLAQDLDPRGVVGDAGAGSAEIGARLVEFYAGRMVDVLLRTRELTWPPGRRPDPSSFVEDVSK
ncbi:MAG: creatininase family protein [Wenzhouxiangellaceae bacterium]|nr:creatininase family protein [Wenzhouxiangellaceae bacterium]